MVKYIDSLTEEQQALIPAWQEKWLDVGCSTEPSPRKKAEAAMRKVLQIEGKQYDIPVIWVRNPMIMTGATCFAKAFHNHLQIPAIDALSLALTPVADREIKFDEEGNLISGTITDKFDWYESWLDGLVDLAVQMGEMNAKQRTEFILKQRATSCFSIKEFQEMNDYMLRHEDQDLKKLPIDYDKTPVLNRSETITQIVNTVSKSWHHHQTTQHWLGYQAAQSFARQVCGLELEPDLEEAAQAYQEVSETTTWWFSTSAFVVAADRPLIFEVTQVDSSCDLSCYDGPAIRWRDGMELYYLEGYVVPRHVVMDPKSQTLEEIRNEENEEIRRIRIEQYGWSDYAIQCDAKIIDVKQASSLDQSTTWLESLLQIDDYHVLMTVDPSTGRAYALEVAACDTCAEAQMYLLGADAFNHIKFQPEDDNPYPIIRT